MDLLLFISERSINFFISCIPLIIVFLQLKIFKLTPKITLIFLLLNLLLSIFFWIKLQDGIIAIYQSVSYVFSFICVWAENILRKKLKVATKAEDENAEGKTGDGSRE